MIAGPNDPRFARAVRAVAGACDAPKPRYTFEFASRYQHVTHWQMTDRQTGETRRVRLDHATDIASLMIDAMPADILAAFNAFREAKRAEDIAHIRARFGDAEADAIPAFVPATIA